MGDQLDTFFLCGCHCLAMPYVEIWVNIVSNQCVLAASTWTSIYCMLRSCGLYNTTWLLPTWCCICSWRWVPASRCFMSLHWRHNGRDCVSNYQPHECFLKRLFRRRSKKTSKLRVTGLCVGISPVTGEFPTQMDSIAEKVSIWWRHVMKHHRPNSIMNHLLRKSVWLRQHWTGVFHHMNSTKLWLGYD